MLTNEQIKSLKKGDKVLAEIEVTEICREDFIEAVHPAFIDDKEELRYSGDNFHRSCLSLPPNKPKYDPCRRFRKGDLVTPKKVNGRSSRGINGEIYRVCQDELESGCEIKLVMDGYIGYVPVNAAYLELVTPVEPEPYSIDPETTTDILKNGEWYAHVCDGDEAERLCKWLNGKWRKEQESDHQNDRGKHWLLTND